VKKEGRRRRQKEQEEEQEELRDSLAHVAVKALDATISQKTAH